MKELLKYNGKAYIVDFEKLKEYCSTSNDDVLTETEITDVSSLDEEETDFVNEKIIKESKFIDLQKNVSFQEMIRTFVFKVIEITGFSDEELTFGEALCFNTCLEYGIIKEI